MASQNQYNQFNVKSFKIKGVEVLPQCISEVNFYESIVSPAILGTVNIVDWQGLDEVGEVFAGDSFEIVFNTDDETELSLKYTIFAKANAVDPGVNYEAVTYQFCSPWLVEGLTRQVSKHYKDKYAHEIIEDLLKECGATIGFIEPTKQKFNHFTTPLWTAVHSITYLMSFIMNREDVGGYVMWTDMKENKVYCTTIDYLYKGTHGTDPKPFTTISENEFYQNRIDSINLESSFDLIRFVNLGMMNTRFDGYFYDKNKVFSTDENVKQIKHTHLSTKLPILSKYLDKKYASIQGCSLHPSTDDLISDDKMYEDMVNGKHRSRYVSLFSDVFKVNIWANPNSTRRTGMLVTLDYQSQDFPKTKSAPQYSGKYIVRDIRHCIVSGMYRHAITLIADGYKESKNDLVMW